MQCTDKTPAEKMLVDKTLSKLHGRQNAGHFMGREGQNPNLNKTLIVLY